MPSGEKSDEVLLEACKQRTEIMNEVMSTFNGQSLPMGCEDFWSYVVKYREKIGKWKLGEAEVSFKRTPREIESSELLG